MGSESKASRAALDTGAGFYLPQICNVAASGVCQSQNHSRGSQSGVNIRQNLLWPFNLWRGMHVVFWHSQELHMVCLEIYCGVCMYTVYIHIYIT